VPTESLLRIKDDSMRELGILDGSVVVVDRALKPRSGQVVFAIVDGPDDHPNSPVYGQFEIPHLN